MRFTEIISSNANISITVDALTLKEFFLDIIQEVENKRANESVETGEEQYLTAKETAKICGVTTPTLWRWNKTNYLKSYKVGGKVRYKLSDVKRIMEGGTAHEK